MNNLYAKSDIFFHNVAIGDNRILNIGQEKCVSNHSSGPSFRSHYLLVYVMSGKGAFRSQNNTYHLGAGSSFVIFPGERIFYVADSDEPWHYFWIAFMGDMFGKLIERASITTRYPVTLTKSSAALTDLFELLMVYAMEKEIYVDTKIISIFLDIMYRYITESNRANRVHTEDMARPTSPHVDYAIDYINKNYDKNISVSELSDYLGITRAMSST